MKTPVILFLIALIIRLAAMLFWQFDGLYGQDPFAYLQQGIAIVNSLPQGNLPPTNFFWPNGFPLLIALFTLLTGKTVLAGQLAVLICGSLLSPLVYLLTKDIFRGAGHPRWDDNGNKNRRVSWQLVPAHRQDNILSYNSIFRVDHQVAEAQIKWAGVLAGLIIAVAGQPILSSIVVMSDMPALFWATVSVWFIVRAVAWLNTGANSFAPSRPRTAALFFLAAGATLALAIITRWIYILVTPALVAYTLFKLRHHKKLWWTPIPAIFSGAIILLPQLYLSFSKTGSLTHSWLTGWQPLNFFLRQFENIDGHFSYLLPGGFYYAQPVGHPAYIFPLLGIGAIWGVWQLGQTRRWGSIILLAGWILPVYLFLGGIPYQNFRFGLTLYVPLVVLTGFGLSKFVFLSSGRISATMLKIIIVLSLFGMLGWAYPMLDSFLTTQNHTKTIARQVEQSLPPKATLLAFGLTLTLQHYTQLNTVELFHVDEGTLDTLTATHNPAYLLLDRHNIQTQWRAKRPDINYRWLEVNTVLTKIDDFPPYTLFKIERQHTYRVSGFTCQVSSKNLISYPGEANLRS